VFCFIIIISYIIIEFLKIFYLGDHSVEVKVDGVHVEGSPFLIKAYDASKVRVTDINTGFVGKPVNFNSENMKLIFFYSIEKKLKCIF